MKHTTKLLTLAFMLATILTLTGCPGPVNTVDVWDDGVVTTEPTCTTEGVKTFTCSNGETRTESIPALGHDFGEWTVTKEATCTEKGSKKHTCTRCGEEETAEIDALGHDYQGGYCERCGVYEFEYHFTIKVFTSSDSFYDYIELSNTSNFEEVKYSFNERVLFNERYLEISINELLSLKDRFKNKNVIVFHTNNDGYGFAYDAYNGYDANTELFIDLTATRIAICIETE